MPGEVVFKKVEICHPEFAYFADLGGIKYDLEVIRKLCLQVEKIDDASLHDGLIVDAIGVAAVIRYVRCFHHTGKRKSLTLDDIISLSDEEREVHDMVKLMRDKHIAHAVSHFEECYCEAYIEIEDGVRQPFSKILTGAERVIFNKNNIWAIGELVSSVFSIVIEKMREEEVRLLSIINSFSEDDIAKFKPHVPLNVDYKKIEKKTLK